LLIPGKKRQNETLGENKTELLTTQKKVKHVLEPSESVGIQKESRARRELNAAQFPTRKTPLHPFPLVAKEGESGQGKSNLLTEYDTTQRKKGGREGWCREKKRHLLVGGGEKGVRGSFNPHRGMIGGVVIFLFHFIGEGKTSTLWNRGGRGSHFLPQSLTTGKRGRIGERNNPRLTLGEGFAQNAGKRKKKRGKI